MAARKKAARKKTTRKKATRKKAPARKKTARKKTAKKKGGAAKNARKTFEANVKALERQMPAGLKRGVRDLRKNMKDLESQIDKAAAKREARWHQLEAQVRKDAVKLLRRLEQAIDPPKRKKKAARKKSARR